MATSLHMPIATISESSSGPTVAARNSKRPSENNSTCQGSRDIFKGQIYPGDVVGVSADPKEARLWSGDDDIWYVYVQGVKHSGGRQILKVIWLYKPADTLCKAGKYPFDNELFISDHCNCKNKAGLTNEDVLCKVSVALHGTPSDSDKDFFIRSTYLQEKHKFVTLKDSHLHCEHQRPLETAFEQATHRYRKGETVLVVANSTRLEPCEIVEFLDQRPRPRVLLRRLLRRSEIRGQNCSPPNELVYSEDLFEAKAEDIERTCFVRFYTAKDLRDNKIPAPYNRNGTGDAFFITTRLKAPLSPTSSSQKVELSLMPIDSEKPETLIEGFDPRSEPPRDKLRGLDLFCGGGNFGRGLAEGGAVEHSWAVGMYLSCKC